VSALPVSLADNLAPLVPGSVHVAPGDAHLTVMNGSFHLERGPLVQGQRPSGDVLFDSVATCYGSRAVGVLLTGMGEDGARGLALMRRAGAHTIAEAQSTAIIWGMPGAAVAMGAAVEQLPLGAIAGRLAELAAAARSGEGAP
jgi:two-component system chemotaxis response regulator CheB